MDGISRKASSIQRVRQTAACWMGRAAFIFLAFAALLFIWMWLRAFMHGDIPQMGWGQKAGNHGPWRHSYGLRGLWWQIINLQLGAFVFALVSVIFKPNRKGLVIAALACVSVILFIITHYWLVD